MDEFKSNEKEFPNWPAENFVSIAVKNCLYRMMSVMRYVINK